MWIADENRQWLWGFRVQLPAAAKEVNDWAWLVPSDNASGWLVADPASQTLAIDLRSLRPTDLWVTNRQTPVASRIPEGHWRILA